MVAGVNNLSGTSEEIFTIKCGRFCLKVEKPSVSLPLMLWTVDGLGESKSYMTVLFLAAFL